MPQVKNKIIKKSAKPAAEKKAVKQEKEKEPKETQTKAEKQKYFEAIGRRKTSQARVRLFTQSKKGIIINQKSHTDYFNTAVLQKTVEGPLEKLKCEEKFGFTIKVKGGGLTGQAEACRHGIARALIQLNPYFKKRLKKFGFLTRDSRMRERKKPGLKRARKAPQWSKR